MRGLGTDYLVVGAGAMGLAFTDALIDHADVHVTVVDRRHASGGHWRDAYPFVRLHQASVFYGVASTVLGDGRVQPTGPESGLHERAGLVEILRYYDAVLERMVATGKVTFLGGAEYEHVDDRHLVTSGLTGQTLDVDVRRRVVDASYLAPTIPSTSPAPFEIAADARLVTINQLPGIVDAPSQFVVVGSGKTATDAIVWLIGNGVDPGRIVWVRPREPWMLNRAVVQPDAAVMTQMAADTYAAAAAASDPDEMFLRLEDAGVVLRMDTSRAPTMAKTPTLARWELDLLRTVERVVRLGHIQRVERGALVCAEDRVSIAPDALVVHCAAPGLSYPPLAPIWQPDRLRLQTIRAGFPCFCAALAGYVEATRDDDRERNRLCPPNVYGNDGASWSTMQARGAAAVAVYSGEPDIARWANETMLNPARVDPAEEHDPRLHAARRSLAEHADAGLANLAAFSGGLVTGRGSLS